MYIGHFPQCYHHVMFDGAACNAIGPLLLLITSLEQAGGEL